jgi:hypothetical protein
MTSFNLTTFLWSDPKAKHTVNYEFTLDHASKLLRQAAKGFEALNAERVTEGKEPYTYYLTLVTDKTDLTSFDFSIPNVRVIPMWQDFRNLGRCFTKLKLFSKNPTDPVYGEEIHRSQLFPADYLISIDLDIVVTNPLEFVRVLTSEKMQPMICYRDSKNPRCASGCLYRFDTRTYGEWHHVYDTFRMVYDTLSMNPEAFRFFYSNWNSQASFVGSDQCWITTVLGENAYPKWDGIKNGIYDYWTVEHLPTLPLNTCAVFLNGKSRDMTLPAFRDLYWVKAHWFDV